MEYAASVNEERRKKEDQIPPKIITVPDALKNLDILNSQQIHMTKRLGSFVTQVAHYNWLLTLDKGSLSELLQTPDAEIAQMADAIQDECLALQSTLKKIIEQA